jgi:hypothetical protein
MKQKLLTGLIIFICVACFFYPVLAAPDTVGAKPPAAVSDPTPADLVVAMTRFMNSLPQFYISGTANYDKVYQDNNKIQYAFDFDYYVKRPSEFQFDFVGDLHNKQILFNGKNLSIYDADNAVYAVIDTPSSIDGALDAAAKEYGLSLSILDVARSDFAANLLNDVVKSAYIGISKVGEIPCHTVVFTKSDRNFQLWIETGERPFLRKVIVTLKNNPAMPSWIVEVADWNLSPVLPDGWSTFVPKPGMKKIEFLKPSDKPATAIK